MIYQVLPSISAHDAISQHAIAIDNCLKQNGYETQIVADYIAPTLSELARPASEISTFDGSHVLYHMSISSRLAEQVSNSNATIDMWYHNITPAQYFESWEPFVALELRIARQQLKQLAVRCSRALAASDYSAKELRNEGQRNVSVMPVLFDIEKKSRGGVDLELKGTNLLYVGRYAPHKKVEKLIEVFSEYKNLCDTNAKLHLVGSSAASKYMESLNVLIDNLGLDQEIVFRENVSDQELADLYKSCDVFVTMSEHEGFCVPILEAIYSKLPVVATNCAAIPETLGNAGISLDKAKPLIEFVNAIDVVTRNDDVMSQLEVNASKRIEEFDLDKATQQTVDWLTGGSDNV